MSTFPKHIAIIMDGNGRWAQARHLPRSAGHRAGAQAVQNTIDAAQKHGISFLTLYAFSAENWNRPQDEIKNLMELLAENLKKYTQRAVKDNLRLWVSGAREPLSPALLTQIDDAITKTASNTGLTVNLALNYGARQEIVQAVNNALAAGEKHLTPELLHRYLYAPDLPDPELIIRTSGEQRLSNFLLWQAAYSEFYFTPVLWPDFDEREFEKALAVYASRKRRFGGI